MKFQSDFSSIFLGRESNKDAYFKSISKKTEIENNLYYKVGVCEKRNVCSRVSKKEYLFGNFAAYMLIGFSDNMGFNFLIN